MNPRTLYLFQRISVTVSPGLLMCRNGTTEPTITTHIWSIGVFGKEKNQEYSSRLFDFFKCHLPVVSEKRSGMLSSYHFCFASLFWLLYVAIYEIEFWTISQSATLHVICPKKGEGSSI